MRAPPTRWNSSSVPEKRPSRCWRSNTSSETSLTTSGFRASAVPRAARRTMLVAYTTSAARACLRTSVTQRAYRRGVGRLRATQCTAKSRAAGGASAVVTTSILCPRARRKSASAGAWLAGPPGSGGQMPDTTRTFTAPSRSPGASDPRPCPSGGVRARSPTLPRTRSSRRAPRPRPRSRPTPRRARPRAG